MSGKDLTTTDAEIADVISGALDDLERMQALMRRVIIIMDDIRGRIMYRHANPAPGPWDDDHPDHCQDS